MIPSEPRPPPAIEATGLAIRRGGTLVADNLDFTVGTGEALLLRGPNGAGKTTLLLTLFGAIRPAAGRLTVSGGDPERRREVLAHFVGHRTAVKPQLSAAENLRFWAAFNGGGGDTVATALARVGLGGLAEVESGHLSAGQARRLALARLLVSSRPIWLLDEPTAALDAGGEAMVARLIDSHCAGGGIVIAATHHDLALGMRVKTATLGAAA